MVRKDWMFMTKQSEVVKSVAVSGVKEILEPPVALNDSSIHKGVKPQ